MPLPVAPLGLSKAGARGISIALPIQSLDPTELCEKKPSFEEKTRFRDT